MVPKKRSSVVFNTIAICFAALMLTGNLFAHGNEKHLMGTVKSVSADFIVVEETSHHTQTVQITNQTKFLKAGQPSSVRELKAGDRVVIHAKPSGNKLEATEVKFGSATTPAATKTHN